jgi:hypothetical protein
MRQLHGEFVPLRLWPPAPIARCLAVPWVDGNRVARRRPNDGPRLSKRRWQQTCRDREEFRCFRSWGLTGRSAYMFVATQMTRMYGPAVRRKRFRRSVGFAVLHQCIRPLIGACSAPGHHGYQRACVLISGQASNGAIWVTSVRMRPEDRSSISFHPLADLGGKPGTMSSLSPDRCSSFVRAMSRSFVPACTLCGASRAGAVKAGRRSCLCSSSQRLQATP